MKFFLKIIMLILFTGVSFVPCANSMYSGGGYSCPICGQPNNSFMRFVKEVLGCADPRIHSECMNPAGATPLPVVPTSFFIMVCMCSEYSNNIIYRQLEFANGKITNYQVVESVLTFEPYKFPIAYDFGVEILVELPEFARNNETLIRKIFNEIESNLTEIFK